MRIQTNWKSQAAIEYLSTYGLAILIILTVVTLLYSFGVFNLTFISPKASPGSCYVYRPEGAGSTYLIAYAGTCSNEEPEYVAKFQDQNNYVYISDFSNRITGSQISMGLWAYVMPSVSQDFGGLSNGVDTAFYMAGTSSGNKFDCAFQDSSGSPDIAEPQFPIPTNEWHYFVITYGGGTLSCYMDGNLVETYTGASGYITNPSVSLDIGYIGGSVAQYFQGSEANVQFYNTSLSANDVAALYAKGIGGAPIDLQNLVGWWPLNGDLKDYSGNGYTGTEYESSPTLTGLTYITNWQSGYSVP